MTAITFDPSAFRTAFPKFANTACFSNTDLQANFDSACCYVSPNYGGCWNGGWTLPQQTQAVNYMTAHITFIDDAIRNGKPLAVLKEATISKVSVSVVPPPGTDKDAFAYWLNLSPYGQALLALLSVVSVGGFYFGGNPERLGFRRVGGGFGGPRRW